MVERIKVIFRNMKKTKNENINNTYQTKQKGNEKQVSIYLIDINKCLRRKMLWRQKKTSTDLISLYQA